MSHPRWPGFNDKTGDPTVDNANRNLNRRIWRDTQRRLKVTAANRKQKKKILRVEGGKYIILVNALAQKLARRDHEEGAPV